MDNKGYQVSDERVPAPNKSLREDLVSSDTSRVGHSMFRPIPSFMVIDYLDYQQSPTDYFEWNWHL